LQKKNLGVHFVPNFITPNFFVVNVSLTVRLSNLAFFLYFRITLAVRITNKQTDRLKKKHPSVGILNENLFYSLITLYITV